eukprot:1195441-Prorocentrum_minimum.AAC.10
MSCTPQLSAAFAFPFVMLRHAKCSPTSAAEQAAGEPRHAPSSHYKATVTLLSRRAMYYYTRPGLLSGKSWARDGGGLCFTQYPSRGDPNNVKLL